MHRWWTSSVAARLHPSLPAPKRGIFVEAFAFASVAIWEPPGFDGSLVTAARSALVGPTFHEVMAKIEAVMKRELRPEHLQGDNYWHLAFLAADPLRRAVASDREGVVGATSACVRPWLRQAEEDGLPVWLEASSWNAVEVYLHWGFRLCGTVQVGMGRFDERGWPTEAGDPSAAGVSIWCMVYDRHLNS